MNLSRELKSVEIFHTTDLIELNRLSNIKGDFLEIGCFAEFQSSNRQDEINFESNNLLAKAECNKKDDSFCTNF